MKKQLSGSAFASSPLSRLQRKNITGGGTGVWILPCYYVKHSCKNANGDLYDAKTLCCEKTAADCKLQCRDGDFPV
jgi:hypothetical protein